jgi:hypothetical protein
VDEKAGLASSQHTNRDTTTPVISEMLNSKRADAIAKKNLDEMAGVDGWTEDIAKAILQGLRNALESGIQMAETLHDAFNRMAEAVVGFAKDHL